MSDFIPQTMRVSHERRRLGISMKAGLAIAGQSKFKNIYDTKVIYQHTTRPRRPEANYSLETLGYGQERKDANNNRYSWTSVYEFHVRIEFNTSQKA